MGDRSHWAFHGKDGVEGPDAEASETGAISALPDPRTPGEVLLDTDQFEAITGESVDGALALPLNGPGRPRHACPADVDPTDAEALWEEERRDLESVENLEFGHRHRLPDLFELTRRHRGADEEVT